MNNPKEPPLATSSLTGLDITSIQFIPPQTFRVEFNFQISSEVAKKRIFTKKRAWDLIEINNIAGEGFHIWYLKPKIVHGISVPLMSISDLLTPEIRYHIENEDVIRQVVLSKNIWLQKSYSEYSKLEREYRVNRKKWNSTVHPCGLTHKEIMDLPRGNHEIGGYFIWRGSWYDGRSHDGFQDLKISPYKRYNDDIRSYLKQNNNLSQAVKIQDKEWMRNFYTFIGALANFYTASPTSGPRPKASVPRKTGPKPKVSNSDKIASRLNRAGELGAEAYGAYSDIKDAMEHYTRSTGLKEQRILIEKDMNNLADLIGGILEDPSRPD
ncbi:MAG: hypothetical protein GY845_02925 [Planctomycetes bacterium]|nr:hypothetical protein [Planctomycetota bacterium]